MILQRCEICQGKVCDRMTGIGACQWNGHKPSPATARIAFETRKISQEQLGDVGKHHHIAHREDGGPYSAPIINPVRTANWAGELDQDPKKRAADA